MLMHFSLWVDDVKIPSYEKKVFAGNSLLKLFEPFEVIFRLTIFLEFLCVKSYFFGETFCNTLLSFLAAEMPFLPMCIFLFLWVMDLELSNFCFTVFFRGEWF